MIQYIQPEIPDKDRMEITVLLVNTGATVDNNMETGRMHARFPNDPTFERHGCHLKLIGICKEIADKYKLEYEYSSHVGCFIMGFNKGVILKEDEERYEHG